MGSILKGGNDLNSTGQPVAGRLKLIFKGQIYNLMVLEKKSPNGNFLVKERALLFTVKSIN